MEATSKRFGILFLNAANNIQTLSTKNNTDNNFSNIKLSPNIEIGRAKNITYNGALSEYQYPKKSVAYLFPAMIYSESSCPMETLASNIKKQNRRDINVIATCHNL